MPANQLNDHEMLDVLKHNKGFARPEEWLTYAKAHGFKKVSATKLDSCPDCGARDFIPLGQYVYYSNLAQLKECKSCRLIYSDLRLAPEVINSHFETAYKDESYFQKERQAIFKQLCSIIDSSTAQAGSVLDIGGAKGHLLAEVAKKRPDLKLVVNDLSQTSCDYAQKEYSLQAICGDIKTISQLPPFNTVVMSDVIYYEPEINLLWQSVAKLTAKDGTLIIRIPNKLLAISLGNKLMRLLNSPKNKHLQDKIPFFNPEHLYIFSIDHMKMRLKELGFTDIKTAPSPLLRKGAFSLLTTPLFIIAKVIATVSNNSIILTPSIVYTAKKI